MARRRRIIAAAALVCTSALVPLQAPRPRRTVSRYSEAVDEDTLLPSGDAQAPETDRRPRNGNRQNQGGGRGRIIQLSNPMRLVRKQRPGGDRRGPPGGQRRGGPPQRVGSTGGPVADVPNPERPPGDVSRTRRINLIMTSGNLLDARSTRLREEVATTGPCSSEGLEDR